MNESSTSLTQLGDADFARLTSEDEYARYFNLLAIVFERMLACYPKEVADSHETGTVAEFLKRLHTTIELLRLKFTHRASYDGSLLVDLFDSGFPSAQEIHNIVQDLLGKKDRLRALPAGQILKRDLLDSLLVRQTDSPDLLLQISEREYLERLSEEKVFLPFSAGTIVRREDREEGQRRYVFSWGCYDFATSRPYVNIMTASQDATQPPLETEGPAWYRFLEVIKAEGSRAPDVGVLAMMIDEAIEWLHPKAIKRLGIGPLYTPLLFQAHDVADESREQRAFRAILGKYARSENDFVVFATDEIVFSKSQELTRSILAPRGRIREIFAITETDPACYKRRASIVNTNVVLPHWVLQNIGSEIKAVFPDWDSYRKITYNDRGGIEVHGI